MLRAKYACHKVMRATPNQQKKLSDKDIFWFETHQLEEEEKNLEKMKLNNKIWHIHRNQILGERKSETSAMIDPDTGERVETREGVIDLLLKFNENLLSREEHQEEFKDIYLMKKEMIDLLKNMEIENYDTFTREEYDTILLKLKKKGKRMFDDFNESGDEFKNLIYHIVKIVYET